MPTRYIIFYDDTKIRRPWCFCLENDDGKRLYWSKKQYKTKAAAAMVAARMIAKDTNQ
jgi:hypothetical protein